MLFCCQIPYYLAPWTAFKDDESIDYSKIPLVAAFEKKVGVTHTCKISLLNLKISKSIEFLNLTNF